MTPTNMLSPHNQSVNMFSEGGKYNEAAARRASMTPGPEPRHQGLIDLPSQQIISNHDRPSENLIIVEESKSSNSHSITSSGNSRIMTPTSCELSPKKHKD
jgi:hypothetical protein